MIGTKIEGFGNKKTMGDHLTCIHYSIIKISQNTEKRSWQLEGTCYHSSSSEKPSGNAGVKKPERSKKKR